MTEPYASHDASKIELSVVITGLLGTWAQAGWWQMLSHTHAHTHTRTHTHILVWLVCIFVWMARIFVRLARIFVWQACVFVCLARIFVRLARIFVRLACVFGVHLCLTGVHLCFQPHWWPASLRAHSSHTDGLSLFVWRASLACIFVWLACTLLCVCTQIHLQLQLAPLSHTHLYLSTEICVHKHTCSP